MQTQDYTNFCTQFQSNEVKGSTHMELLGLKRGLRDLELNNIQVQDLVTDRHVMIKSYMKKDRPEINHYFDVWHIAKGTVENIQLRIFYSGVILYIYCCNFVSFFRNIKKTRKCRKKAWSWPNKTMD